MSFLVDGVKYESVDEYKVKMAIKVNKAHKYHAEKSIDSRGNHHPSKVEAAFANMLYVLESAGEIIGLKQQTGLSVGDILYKPDFIYHHPKTNTWVVVDVKGFEGERFRLVCQIWRKRGGDLGRQHFRTLTIAKRKGWGWDYRKVEQQ